jgi:hypothetical protein
MADAAETPEAETTFQFHGRLLPMGYKMNMGRPVENLIVTPTGKIPISFRVEITASIILVECAISSELTEDIFQEAYSIAHRVTFNVVDLMCFQYGLQLTVNLESWTDPAGRNIEIRAQDVSLLNIVSSVDNNNLDVPLKLLFDEPHIAVVLHDLTQALHYRENTTINCARAIDGMKHLLSPDEKDDAAAWAFMRDVLNLDLAYVVFITTASRDGRHRKPVQIPSKTISLVLNRSWNIMNRYFEYRLRNAGPLRDPEFPLLTG